VRTNPDERGRKPASVTATTEQRQRLIGIGLMVGAVACFACLDASAKWVNRTTDPIQTASVRYVGSFLLVSAFLNPWTRAGIQRTRSPWLQGGRALCLVVATVCSFTGLRYLPLTQMTSITFASPLIVALIAGPILGERIGARRLTAVLVGFAGVLVVTRPSSGGMHPAALLAVAAACANALYSVTTRLLASRDSAETTLFYTGLVGSLVMLPVAPFVWAAPASALVWLLMAALAVFGTLGHWLLILAHKRTPASTLAPFFYAQLLWATVLGFLVFGEAPDRWTLIGGGIVMASGLHLLFSERAARARAGLAAQEVER
jgi:drug/metabolite transporter (DMT)-like permease